MHEVCVCVCVCIPDGKVHHCVQFVPPTSIIGESLQVHHQNARQRPQIKLFGGLLVFLTCWTVPKREMKSVSILAAEGERCRLMLKRRGSSPGVVFSQCLHGGEELDALLQGHRGFLLLRLQHALVFLVGLDNTRRQILADCSELYQTA